MTSKPLPILALVVALSGCAATGSNAPPPLSVARPAPIDALPARLSGAGVPPDAAMVVLYRSSAWDGRLNDWRASVAGEWTTLANGERAGFAVAPGTVILSAFTMPSITNLGVGALAGGRPELAFEAQAGMAYFVEMSAASWGGPGLTLMPAEAAIADAVRLRESRRP
jgi:hypothetical protein